MAPAAPKASPASEVPDLDRAWDLVESGDYAGAEQLFRSLVAAGDSRGWRGISVCLRDSPRGRNWEEFSEAAINVLSSVSDEGGKTEIALTVSNIALPLALYVIDEQLKTHKQSSLGFGALSAESFGNFSKRIQPWLAWTSNVVDFTHSILLEVEVDSASGRSFYEHVGMLTEKVNDLGLLRDTSSGEGPNTRLAGLAQTGMARYL
jgi:hypothetical protein